MEHLQIQVRVPRNQLVAYLLSLQTLLSCSILKLFSRQFGKVCFPPSTGPAKMSLRDANVVIIEVARTSIRSGIGLYDLLKTPTIVC